MKTNIILKSIVLVTAFLAFHLAPFTSATTQVKWHSIEDASQAKIGTKLYLVDFYTDWCGYCRKMDRETFSDATVAKIIDKYYYPVKFNAEGRNVFTWAGHTYRSAGRVHEFAKGVRGYPTTVLFTADGKMMQSIPGFLSAKEYTVVLWYFASGDYQRYPYEQYSRIFDAEIRPQMEKQLK